MKQVGLIGYPVKHSLSPVMQQAAFDALGIAARYSLYPTPPGTLEERIDSLRLPDVLGANVTLPYKEAIPALIDECDPLAARIGAVNTIVHRDGRLIGYNTDAPGMLRALEECGEREAIPFDSHGKKKAVILGTGGAARAAAVALLDNGIEELTLLGRTEAHLRSLAEHLGEISAASTAWQPHPRVIAMLLIDGADRAIGERLASADVVINATSLGLQADDTRVLIDVNMLRATTTVMDMIFNPPMTPLLRAAQARGCPVLNGLSMLLHQGAMAFELWTGQPAPVDVMRRALGIEG